MAGLTKKKQALHDKIAGALVVNKRESSVGVAIGAGCLGMILAISLLAAIGYSSFLSEANSEAKQYIGTMNRAQQAFYIENDKFADELSKLDIRIDSETENYSYSIDADTYSLFRKQVEHFCAKLELYSMQTQFSYGTLLSGP